MKPHVRLPNIIMANSVNISKCFVHIYNNIVIYIYIYNNIVSNMYKCDINLSLDENKSIDIELLQNRRLLT